MMSQWISSNRYSALRTSDDNESLVKPSLLWSNWFTLRRVRTALILALLVGLGLTLARFSDVKAHIQDFVPHRPISDGVKNQDGVQWSEFAYVQYVTNANYLCNSLMILESLYRLGAKADRIILYPNHWKVPTDDGVDSSFESKLLAQARDQYKTKLVPIQVQTYERGDNTWKDSYTKLLAFNQTQYKRVISLDSDATVQQPMDELFLLPPAPVAMPRAYWLDQLFLSSQLVVLEPSEQEWKRIQNAMQNNADSGFDMDILNTLYNESCTIIPHRKYDLLSGEFRSKKHDKYLGADEPWDPKAVLEEAKFVHFSDWPRPKPWLKADSAIVEEVQPKCKKVEGEEDCTDRDIWLSLYQDFSQRRQRICGRRYDDRRRVRRSMASRLSKNEPRFE
ncbi:nucleotide-diphospho-sugar transferase [Lojkania enalia]|uniref:Nucleotide-diphospho-sugar transferase n=1 Tax=Lojkania enalia TaxID=147567 RepID=A0A9P4KCK9_9PLEO|nr:nucleotide-diphospho-sugar transferase [Didymosphaeria enalia]